MSENAGKLTGSYLNIEAKPSDFNYNHFFSDAELLEYLKIYPGIDLQCRYLVDMALEAGIKFAKEQPIEGEKFGNDWTFPTFIEYLKWIGAYDTVSQAMMWGRNLGLSICAVFLPDEEPDTDSEIEYYEKKDKTSRKRKKSLKGKDYYGPLKDEEIGEATRVEAYHPRINGNGYTIAQVVEGTTNEPEIYKIYYTNRDAYYEDSNRINATKTYFIHASRVVEFHWKNKEMGRRGETTLNSTIHLVKTMEEATRAVYTQLKDLQAGITIFRADDQPEAEYMNKKTENFDHKNKVAYSGDDPLDDVLHWLVPEMKADQLERILLMMKKEYSQGARVSLRALGEEDIATGLGEGGVEFSQSLMVHEIKSIQEYYRKPLEHIFYHLGKDNTAFEWGIPFMKDAEMIKEQIQDQEPNADGNNNPKDDKSKKDESQ
jgi:hypothetical protein